MRILSSATNSTSTVPLLSKGGEADTGFQALLANVSADKSLRAVALVQKDTNAEAASPGVNSNLRETSQPSTSASSSDQRKSAPVASAPIGNTSEPVQKTVARLQEADSRAVDESPKATKQEHIRSQSKSSDSNSTAQAVAGDASAIEPAPAPMSLSTVLIAGAPIMTMVPFLYSSATSTSLSTEETSAIHAVTSTRTQAVASEGVTERQNAGSLIDETSLPVEISDKTSGASEATAQATKTDIVLQPATTQGDSESSAIAATSNQNHPVKPVSGSSAPVAASADSSTAPQATSGATADSQSNIQIQPALDAGLVAFDLPVNVATPNAANATQSPDQAISKKPAADIAGMKNTDFTNAMNTTSRHSDAAIGTTATSHSSQSNGQQAQNSQGDSSSVVEGTPKAVDGSKIDVQPVVVAHAISNQDSPVSHKLENAGSQTETSVGRGAEGTVASDGSEAVKTSSIHAATVVQAMSETEMRVGLHTSEFGNISIRTTISQQQMVAQISLDHVDLSRAIANHVAAAQAKLGEEHGLNAQIEVHNYGASTSADGGNASQRDSRSFTNSTRDQKIEAVADAESTTNLRTPTSADSTHRLDIRA